MNILLYITNFDKSYLPGLKGMFGTNKVFVKIGYSSIGAVVLDAMKHQAKAVVTTDAGLLKDLATRDGWDGTGERPSLDNYQGSIFHISGGVQVLILNPLRQIFSVNQGQFIAKRFISKITKPEQWFPVPAFTYEVLDESTVEAAFERFKGAKYLAIDIETNRWVNAIDCISYCAIFVDPNTSQITAETVVFSVTDMFWVAWMRKFNQLPAEKIFQNGKYDVTYFYIYDAIPTNWLWDTIDLFHSWYSELPKALDFQSAFLVLDFKYWKHESALGREAKLQYNAKDSWVTAMAFLSAVWEMPKWAMDNYVMEFPLVPACMYCELQGIRANEKRLVENQKKVEAIGEQLISRLQKMTVPGFNPRSPVQVKKLMHILGHRDCEDTNEKTLQALAFKHPLTGLLVEGILEYRGVMKLVSTYLVPEKIYKGRIFFCLNPFGTDSGRLASREHALSYVSYRAKKGGELKNIGLQIQNIPVRDELSKLVREYFEADEGFLWGEADYEQAEARDTAYLSGDTNLIAAVDGDRDFHAVNGSAFFGIPYEQIVNEFGKVINKVIRDLAKKVNHGSNYNMGPSVLVQTMGLKNIYKAKELLKLPASWGPMQIAEHLLDTFTKAYPVVKGAWYTKVIGDVLTTGKLVGPTGWTRYCFGKPDKNKQDLNAYVAHPPQSLNAMTLNRAFKKLFYEVLPGNFENLRIKAQIHDSILFQYRDGHPELAELVKEAMEFPVTVKDTFGIERELLVPAAVNHGKRLWGELK